jgi:hypothetical protein
MHYYTLTADEKQICNVAFIIVVSNSLKVMSPVLSVMRIAFISKVVITNVIIHIVVVSL